MSGYYDKKFDKGKKETLLPYCVAREIYAIPSTKAEDLTPEQQLIIWVHKEILGNDLDQYPVENTVKVIETVLQHGAEKYGKDNWQTVPDAEQRYYSAYRRHAVDHHPNEIDKDSGLLHGYHALCNIAFLIYFQLNK